MKQVTEARDSLAHSNRLYEQLEVKFEESEDSNKQLQKMHRTNQVLLEKKTIGLEDMDKELVQLRMEREELHSELDKLRKQVEISMDGKEKLAGRNNSPWRDRTPVIGPFDGRDSESEDAADGEQQEAELARLRKAVRDLSVKLQSSVSRKNQLEREMEELVADNAGLSHTLEKMDADMGTLQMRLEEVGERDAHMADPLTEPTPPTTPQQLGFSKLATGKSASRNQPIDTIESNSSLVLSQPHAASSPSSTSSISDGLGPSSMAVEGSNNKHSLFSELDQEYSSLQHKYQELLRSCNCSGGQSEQGCSSKCGREYAKTAGLDKALSARGKGSPAARQGAFKELFDELFTTLRETSLVADKLIERSSKKNNKK